MSNQELENKQLGLELNTEQQAPQSSLTKAYDKLNQYFDDQNQQQRAVEEARDILGESATTLTDEELYDLTNEMQFLVDTWIEEFERDVFEGKTLKDLLQLDI